MDTTSELREILRTTSTIRDLGGLFAALGYKSAEAPFDERATVVARWNGFQVVGVDGTDARNEARRLARRLGTACVRALAVAVGDDAVVLAAPRLGAPGVHRLFAVPRRDPTANALQHLDAFRPRAGSSGLSHALRVGELLDTEIAGERFFVAFRDVYTELLAELGRRGADDDRRMAALLPLLRILFLYFVQAKGWLDGRGDYLRSLLDETLRHRRSFHDRVLLPLCFGTLNRKAAHRRGVGHLGHVPYLNGGLFDTHPAEQRIQARWENNVWRRVFDDVFERFRFCVREADEVDAIAPDMLGRVFERIMDEDARHESGTFYTPEIVVRQVVRGTLEAALVNGRLSRSDVSRLLQGEPIVEPDLRRYTRRRVGGLRVLDPAVGSGAFLLGALEALTDVQTTLSAHSTPRRRLAIRRRILRNNLFGVDINPVAVRLAELRLWLAVIADDPTTDIDRVEPLPNLDGVVRQGDTLLDPIAAARLAGVGVSLPPRAVRRVAECRHAVYHARGPSKQRSVKSMHHAERTLATDLLQRTLDRCRSELQEFREVAANKDLFGQSIRLERRQRERRALLRREAARLRRALRGVGEGRLPFFSFEVHAPDDVARGGFDLVVGNPPWVRAERLAVGTRETLKTRYTWWNASGGRGFRHQPDLAVAFLQRAVELTKSGGAVGFLVPSKIASAAYGVTCRANLTESYCIHYLHRTPAAEAAQFRATTYPLVIVLRHERPRADHAVRLDFAGDDTVPQRALAGDGPWVLVPDSTRRALAELQEAGTPLEQVAPPVLGVKTGADRLLVGHLESSTPSYGVVRFGEGSQVEIERHLLREVVRGRDVEAFQVRTRCVVVWAYDAKGQLLTALPPRARKHIMRHRTHLARRSDANGESPWALFRLGAADQGHRVVWADIAKRPAAVVLEESPAANAIPLNTCYVSRNRDRVTALGVTAVLNSSFASVLTRFTADEARGGYRRINARIAGRIPIPDAAGRALLADYALARHHHAKANGPLDDLVAEALALPARTRDRLLQLDRGLG